MARTSLGTDLCGLKLQNPTILASGILGETAGSLIKVAKNGAGAVVTKSICVKPRTGYHNPTFIDLDYGILNAMGLPNPGIDEYSSEMQEYTKRSNVPVIASIFGSDKNEFVTLAKKMETLNAAALELNLSCPHVSGTGSELGCDAKIVESITRSVKGSVRIPVFVKLTPNITDIVDIAKAVEKGGGDAVVAINTVKGMAIDVEMKYPVLYNKVGGYSGPAIRPIGVRAVYDIYKQIKIPIIGCGGISTGRDAIEYILAGATAVEIGSAVYYRGIMVFKQICDEIQDYLDKHKINNISKLTGAAKKA